MTLNNKHLVVIAGPTASGKTAIGIRAALHYRSEIISADSRQFYSETRIGTAVPAPGELAMVPHHFVQVRSINSYYNASMFEQDVLDTLEQLFRKHDIVFMVGGSGLYIDAVCSGIDELPTVDPVIRKKLADQYENEGIESIQKALKKADPVSYERIDLNNHLRVLKALEVFHQTGRPYSGYLTQKKKERKFNIVRIALHRDREELYDRINRRVDQMMEEGLLEEVKSLLPFRNTNAMKTVGYRELFAYLDGETDLHEAVQRIKNNSRKYARKQITWFRKNDRYRWMNPDRPEEIISFIGRSTGITGNRDDVQAD